jgi:3'(2'), 5'-bisphosphate nucleotidase
MEWDTGAAHAIVNESSHVLRRYSLPNLYQQHKYNKKSLLNKWFVVYQDEA